MCLIKKSSFLKYLFGKMKDREKVREKGRGKTVLPPTGTLILGAKSVARNSVQVSHMGGRDLNNLNG